MKNQNYDQMFNDEIAETSQDFRFLNKWGWPIVLVFILLGSCVYAAIMMV